MSELTKDIKAYLDGEVPGEARELLKHAYKELWRLERTLVHEQRVSAGREDVTSSPTVYQVVRESAETGIFDDALERMRSGDS